ncbi:MAG: VCBS repeat-containing protein, partial [Planctomycetes bacterium]|nr:VCBS repeat-containing protein [Planctomycetota bacterium]
MRLNQERVAVKQVCSAIVVAWLFSFTAGSVNSAEKFHLHTFDRIQLTDVYYSEGANFGDLNRDGVMDIVYGPFWFQGPDYKTKHEIYPAIPQNTNGYADNFFSWIYDFNGDGWNDVFVVGFPGTPAYVYENPKRKGIDQNWTKHEVFDWVSNESPFFGNFVGDERPELVCTRDGYFGYAVVDWAKPFSKWTFHKVSKQVATPKFGHGLGVGDIDGDERLDLITKDGWFQQPKSLADDPQWTFHKVAFAPRGGAEMYAYDVDGDGDNDVITSLSAHAFGLAWFEQIIEDGNRTFRKHLIMGSKKEENRYGVLFSELHTVNLVDMDGDGLKDIVTGKTYWSHHKQSPLWDAGAVVYWFKLVRNKEGVDWIPILADGESGVGRQVSVGDVNGDTLPDIV